ncbi:MAG: ATP-binding protein [Acidimicrobiales bacterium]
MRSLRSRLAAFAAIGAIGITLAASLAIAFERWQEETVRLVGDVELASVLLSESGPPASVTIGTGERAFALIFDGSGETTSRTGPVDVELADLVAEDIWSQTVDEDTIVTSEYESDGGRRVVVAGTRCVDATACDSVAVGATERSFGDYLSSRWLWLTGPALVAGGLVWAGARLVVGRSLRPVDEMRVELAAITSTDLDRRVAVPSTGDELEALGSTLNETIDRLAAAVAANERFVADAAHELRSPITGVRAALELEAARNPAGILEDSVQELDRAGKMMDDLLVLARRQGRPPRRSEVDVDDIVTRELSAVTQRVPGLVVDRSVSPVRAIADGDSLRRVVTNLLDNAARYGGGRLAVTLRPDGIGWTLMVEDDGPGVPDGRRDEIFERFARLDDARARSAGGSGLGLALVRELVADHGGTVTVSDSSLGGAAFTVWIPRDPVGATSTGPSHPR